MLDVCINDIERVLHIFIKNACVVGLDIILSYSKSKSKQWIVAIHSWGEEDTEYKIYMRDWISYKSCVVGN